MIEGKDEASADDESQEEGRIEIVAEGEGEVPASNGDREAVEELERALEGTREQLLRTAADFENYRRRNERERSEIRRYAAVDALREFLRVLDNLDLAVSSKGSPEDLRSGVEMVVRQIRTLLTRFGVEEIAAEGEPFDPSIHEAIARFEDDTVTRQVVAEELQKGYQMGDRLLRPAMVKVAVPVARGSREGKLEDDDSAGGESPPKQVDVAEEGERPKA